MQAIYFDMDGTIADLYGVSDWLPKLRDEDVTPYVEAQPLVNMDELNNLLTALKMQGLIIGVISWVAGNNPSKEYVRAIRKAKKDWLNKHLPIVDEVHIIKYGYPKQKAAKRKRSILVDDNEQVRASWVGKTPREAIDASNPNAMIEELRQLVKVA